MKKTKIQLIFTLILVMLAAAMMTASAKAQDLAKNAVKPAAEEKKAETITLDKNQVMEVRALQAELRAAQLELENAIPQKLKDQVKAANDAVSDFWKKLGIDGAKLTEWQPVPREDGSIVLTKVKKDVPPAKQP